LRRALRGKRVYIDTNVFIYVALKHPDFYASCKRVLELLVEEEFEGYGSHLVLFELFGALSKISPEAAWEAATAYLDLPLSMLTLDRSALQVARDIAKLSGVTYDSLHAALAGCNGVEVVVTEDLEDWERIAAIWDRVRRVYGMGELAVLSPIKGFIGSNGLGESL